MIQTQIQTQTGKISLAPEGYIRVEIFTDAKQDIEDAKKNMQACIDVGGGTKRPLLTDIRFCQPLTPEARRYYSGKALNDSFTALAILIESSHFGMMMGNVYLRIAKPGIPTQLFQDDQKAIGWLMRYR